MMDLDFPNLRELTNDERLLAAYLEPSKVCPFFHDVYLVTILIELDPL